MGKRATDVRTDEEKAKQAADADFAASMKPALKNKFKTEEDQLVPQLSRPNRVRAILRQPG